MPQLEADVGQAGGRDRREVEVDHAEAPGGDGRARVDDLAVGGDLVLPLLAEADDLLVGATDEVPPHDDRLAEGRPAEQQQARLLERGDREGRTPLGDVGEVAGLDLGAVHLDEADVFEATVGLADATIDGFDALVLPGGVANPDELRTRPEAVHLIRAFAEAGKPIAAICHAPWTLIDADLVTGKRLTSWPTLQLDLQNAGAEWIDEQVVVDGKLVTSRKPDDIPAFNQALLSELRAAEGQTRH